MDQQLPQQPNSSQPKADDEITLKDIILKIQQWWAIVWPKKYLIIAISLLIGLSAALHTKFIKLPTYTASYQLFFQEESGGLSGAMRLASSFGLGGGGGSASSSAIVQEFITSRNNIAHAMTAELENGRLIDRYYQEAIEEDEEFAQEFTSKFGANQRYTDSVLIQVALGFNENVLGVSFDKKTEVLEFSVVAFNESFTYDLATLLVENTESQFKELKKKKGLATVAAFQNKVDSIELSLDATLRRLGEYQDQNNSLISAVDRIEQMRLTIDMEALKVAYGEYIKGLEVSKADLMNLESPITYFDEPVFPLQKNKGSAATAGVFGSIITALILVLFFIGRVEVSNFIAD